MRIAQRSTQLVAVGLNCCSPALVLPLLETVSQLRSPALPWVVYPNSGEEWDTSGSVLISGVPENVPYFQIPMVTAMINTTARSTTSTHGVSFNTSATNTHSE